jgi:hypothetical protein
MVHGYEAIFPNLRAKSREQQKRALNDIIILNRLRFGLYLLAAAGAPATQLALADEVIE